MDNAAAARPDAPQPRAPDVRTPDLRADVMILGAGLVGSTLAIALARHGLSVAVVDPGDPAAALAPSFDGRASAIASASHRLLDAIGVGERLAGQGCPIRHIRVSDGLAPGKLDFKPAETDAPLGTMYENRQLRAALQASLAEAPGVTLRMQARATHIARDLDGVTATLSTGETVSADLLVAAEGRRSPTREAAGIPVATWRYDHTAIVGAFHHQHSHENVAFEIFYPAGPFALLPLPDDADGHRSAIVWTVDARDAPGMLKLGDRGFLAEAHARMGGFLGTLSLPAPRMSYPLGFHHAARLTDTRLALIGDAGHGIHPIAGQGLNLGFRDVATLAQVLVEGRRLGLEAGDAQLLARYERWRGLDTTMVGAATDTLTRLFGVPGKAASAVRRLGIGLVDRLPPLKDRFMAEARGESGDLPKLLMGLTV